MWLQVILHPNPQMHLRKKFLIWAEWRQLGSTAHYDLSFRIHYFVISENDVQIHDLGWFKSTNESISTNPRHGHRYTVNPPSPRLKSICLRKEENSRLHELLPSSQATELAQHRITSTNFDV